MNEARVVCRCLQQGSYETSEFHLQSIPCQPVFAPCEACSQEVKDTKDTKDTKGSKDPGAAQQHFMVSACHISAPAPAHQVFNRREFFL